MEETRGVSEEEIMILFFKIASTVFLSLSAVMCFIMNINVFGDNHKGFGVSFYDDMWIMIPTLIGWLWRAFVIVTLWVVL